ncbi:MAG TPA: hypothetical protein VHV49_03475 [Pseudonocardiaceae bacterium]|jgi:hypothetical protein|nr:hypothetical protein [Pseudonocardiaceae bacterium]
MSRYQPWPPSAFQHRAWWADNSAGWQSAGWQADMIELNARLRAEHATITSSYLSEDVVLLNHDRT